MAYNCSIWLATWTLYLDPCAFVPVSVSGPSGSGGEEGGAFLDVVPDALDGGGDGVGLARGGLGGSPARKGAALRNSAAPPPPTLSLPPNAPSQSRSTSMFLSSSPDLLSRRSTRGSMRDTHERDLDLVI